MKNLKKLSRTELKKVSGGDVLGTWCCVDGHGHQSKPVSGDSDALYCPDAGTSLSRCGTTITPP